MTSPNGIDPRVAFYLEHREQIEQWHAIRRDAARACAEILEQLPDMVDSEIDAPGFETISSVESGKWRHVGLKPSGSASASDGTPCVAVIVEWTDKVIFDDPTQCPYVGIRVAYEGEWAGVYEQLRNDTRETRHERGAKRTRMWPIQEHICAEHGWWTEPDAYLNQIVSALAKAVDEFSHAVVSSLPRE